MKNKKFDFKKLAFMGITGGVMLAQGTACGEESESLDNSYSGQGVLIAGHNCGAGACGGMKKNYNSCGAPTGGGNNYNGCGAKTNNGCGARRGYLSEADSPMGQDEGRGMTARISESELVSQLNDEGKMTYNSLSPEGKALALKLANEGQNGEPMKDKNEAVKLAAKKMSEKRNSMSGWGSSSSNGNQY